MAELRLAPAAIVRAAAWPLEKLDGLGDPALAARAAAGEGPGFEDAYARAVERERRALWGATAGDPAFLRALMLANPPLARRAVELRHRRVSATRVRRMEHALFRHLSRAVGRTEPGDLWAGVTLAAWGSDTVVEPRPARVRVSPDLRPFQAMLRALGRRPAYRRSSTWRVNATLATTPEGGWRYLARLGDGRVAERRVAPNALADGLVRRLPRRPRTLARMADELGAPAAVLDAYVDAGILVGGLDLPARFATPWDALAQAGRGLLEPEAAAWEAALAALRRIGDALEPDPGALGLDELERHLDEASATVARLAEDLGLEPIRLPRTVLRCDLAAPWRVTLGSELRTRLVAALDEYERRHADGSPARAVRSAIAARLTAQVGDGRALADAAAAYASPRVQAATWEDIAGRAVEPRPADGAGAPLGCLLVELRGAGRAPALAIRGVLDEVAPLYGRYAALWGPVHPAPDDPLFRWLRAELRDLERRSGVAIVELAGPCEANPNALAGPDLASEVVELWGASEQADGLAGAEVFTDPVSGAPMVRLPDRDAPAALFSFVAGDIARGDRVSELLLQTSLRVTPGPSFQASALATELEVRAGRPRPELRLPGGALVRPRRTTLAGGTLAGLLSTRGPARYALWQQLAREHGWPAYVRVRAPAEHGLLMPTTSPLALEAVLDRVPADTATLIVDDAEPDAWLTRDGGARFVAELAVPFRRRTHAWSSREREAVAVDAR